MNVIHWIITYWLKALNISLWRKLNPKWLIPNIIHSIALEETSYCLLKGMYLVMNLNLDLFLMTTLIAPIAM